MAAAILGVLAESISRKAFSLASEEISRVWGVRDDIETLRERVETIRALLSDAERKDPDNCAVQRWLKSLRAVATDADNLLDRIAYEGLRKKIEKGMLNKVSHCFTSSNSLVFRRFMANRIKEINLALDKVNSLSGEIGLIAHAYSSEIRSDRITHPFVDDSKIVGRGDDLEKILKWFPCAEDENNLPVIGIVGMPGQGKTAIAQLIYNSEKVSNFFGKRIWICVSEDFKVEKILNEMLQSLSGKKFELTLREPIVKELKKELSNNRLLLILDDVWNEEQELWDCMRDCLREICGANGCRILVTTRSQRVLSTMQASFTHHLEKLSDDDSWTLFEKIAFGKGGAVETPELVNIGTRIVKRCGGVPLAIKTLGGLMYSKKFEQEWLEIEENKMWSSSNAVQRVRLAIKLSYDNLPLLSLKQCFAFCSIYAKDSVLEKHRLVELWMAQGFLNPPHENSQLDMEHIGHNYFNALLQRSLLQDAQVNDYNEIVSCKMHDLVHDFALQVSKDYCLNIEDGVINNDCTAVHLLIRSNKMVKMSKERLQKVRTLILEHCDFAHINLAKCKHLRALVVCDLSIKNLPSSIGQLKHLRHLNIEYTSIKSLPDTITKLYHLQTLRVGRWFKKFPKDFGNMLNLRHLYIHEAGYRHFPQFPRIGNLTSLQTLNYFGVSQDRKSQIEELSNLQNLGGDVEIHGLENVKNKCEAKKAKLSDKKNIACLELYWHREGCNDETVLEGLEPHSNLKVLKVVEFAGKSLPSWMVSQRQTITLRNLVEIVFSYLPNCEYIPPLGHLPYLKFVYIGGLRSLKCIGNEFYGFSYLENAAPSSSQSASPATSVVAFPSLQILELSLLDECVQWLDPHLSPLSFKVFPHLKKLIIASCRELNCIPNILTSVVTLELLEIRICNNLISIPSIGGLPSLRDLKIEYCGALATLPSGLEACTSLQKLRLCLNSVSWIQSLSSLLNLRELELFLMAEGTGSDYFPWPSTSCSTNSSGTEHGILEHPNFDSLEYLCLEGLPSSTIKSLPEQIQHLPVLRRFVINNFPCMEALPEWLGNIHSLQILNIGYCDKLAYLPSTEAMLRLKSLLIWGCPILRERCRKEEGPEWHKIAHIPDIYMV